MKNFFSVIIFFLFGCNHSCSAYPYDRIDLHSRKFYEYVEKLGYRVSGNGGAFSTEEVCEVMIFLRYDKKVDIAEARRMIVPLIQYYTESVNSDLALRPCLHEYPFTAKEFRLAIGFEGKKDLYGPPHIGYVSCKNGVLEYSHKVENKRSFLQVHKESFEEAIKKINDEGLHVVL